MRSIGISGAARKAVQTPMRTLVTALISVSGLAVGAAVAWADPIGAAEVNVTMAPTLDTIEIKHAAISSAALTVKSEPRPVVRVQAKPAALSATQLRSRQIAIARTSNGARLVARDLMARKYDWSSAQFACLDRLWTRESNWRYRANNKTTGAYGIPQALPGTKMSTISGDWRTNPVTQITWGLTYIDVRYGSPCNAWSFFQEKNWY